MSRSGNFYALITGVNGGVGFAIAHRLARDFLTKRPSDHLTLIITTRTRQKGDSTLACLKTAIQKTHSLSNVTLDAALVDLSDTVSVSTLARHVSATYPRLDVLILNAAMGAFIGLNYPRMLKEVAVNFVRSMTYPSYKIQEKGRVTPDGLGAVFASNVFGHYCLAHELMDSLERAHGRIIWQGSLEAYEWSFDPTDLQGIRATHSYEHTKRLVDLLALTSSCSYSRSWRTIEDESGGMNTGEAHDGAHRYAGNVQCFVAHPGICSTSIFPQTTVQRLGKEATMYIARWLGSPWHVIDCYRGALPTVWLALADQETLESRRAQRTKWGASCDFWGRESLMETAVDGFQGGLPSEAQDVIACEVWRGMEGLRVKISEKQ